ncbi:NXPE family member 3-like, partial [Sardina pilchardus]|uniref:NXPE family member 3-like n=1 Tax=Sardina pilchardus TaxID=27697 RepID=UPI002E151325
FVLACRFLHWFLILAVGNLFVLLLLSYTFGCGKLLLGPHQQQCADRPDRLGSNETQTTLKGPTPALPVSGDPGFSPEEWDRIQQAIHWPEPDREISNASVCTSAAHSTFIINDFKQSYTVGEEVFATIFAKDFTSTPKRYGGDFFQAKAYSAKLKASVFGEVVDHQNGTYTARFRLPWAGPVTLAVRLIHSSEAVRILKQWRRNDADRIYFLNYFRGASQQLGGATVEEVVECNVKWPGVKLSPSLQGRCEYHDALTGLTWQCHKPPTLTCQDRVFHSGGGFNKRNHALEEVLMDSQHVNQWLTGDSRLIRVTGTNLSTVVSKPCKPGLPTPVPAGFYLNDVWTSLVCAARHFSVPDIAPCLRDKDIYFFGDSTIRQWFSYLNETVPTLNSVNIQTEPLMAVDLQNNVAMHYRTHGLPLHSGKIPVATLHYMSSEIDGLAGGSRTVVVLNLCAHFTSYPLTYYAYRVWLIRRSVVALLKRAPGTKVIIKTANTGYNKKHLYRSDWLTMQVDRILQEGFRDVGVYMVDVWQMTSCHYLEDNLHPFRLIVKNGVDILLSFICPR